MIRGILACDKYGGISKDGTLPWPHNKYDLQWFKKCTENHIVVMGRNTWEDPLLPKPLPNRYNIVVSDSYFPSNDTRPNIVLPRNKLISYLKATDKDIWVIGGSILFEATWHLLEELWISEIRNNKVACDKFIPSLDPFVVFYKEYDYDKQLFIKKYRKK